jgi:plasmid stabilization system protein ParE
MIVEILPEAEKDLELAFDYYQAKRFGLGDDMLDEFRAGIDRILEYPRAWQAMDRVYRRYRLHRFPYGIIYRLDSAADRVIIVAIMHLSRQPRLWRQRRSK